MHKQHITFDHMWSEKMANHSQKKYCHRDSGNDLKRICKHDVPTTVIVIDRLRGRNLTQVAGASVVTLTLGGGFAVRV